jgi:hypothetical protein
MLFLNGRMGQAGFPKNDFVHQTCIYSTINEIAGIEDIRGWQIVFVRAASRNHLEYFWLHCLDQTAFGATENGYE